jgi:hypothetical protein
MKLFAPGFAAACALVVTAGCGGGGSGMATPGAPIGGGGGSSLSASRTTVTLSNSGPTTHDLPPAGGIAGTVTFPAASGAAGATVTVSTTTTAPPGTVAPQASGLHPLDVGGASVLFLVTLTSPTTFTLNGFPSFSFVFPQTQLAAGQFFIAANGPTISPPVAGVQAQARTLGPAAVNGASLAFTGFTDPLTIQAGQTYTFALGALEEETRSAGLTYPLFTGTKRAALDATEATGEFSAASNTVTFSALMAGPVNSGQDNFYAFGINRGGTTIAPFPQEPNVQFNAVVTVEQQAGGGVSAFLRLVPGSTTPLPASDVTITGAKVAVSVPASALPSLGRAASSYTWALWSETTLGAPPAQIQKFIPDNALAALLPGVEAAPPAAP